MVAGDLRRDILDGILPDGAELPRQEDLLATHRVSKPSLREALRILENEGLITVRRGNVGGAVVHVPKAENAAYTLGLVLQSRAVTLPDVGIALGHVESVCAGLCAQREDRMTTVVPQLREVHAAAGMARDDALELTVLTRRFHELLVELCGNATMIVVAGALEALWSRHQQDWAQTTPAEAAFEDQDISRKSLSEHERIISQIEKGSAEAVARAVGTHLRTSVFYQQSEAVGQKVRAATLRADVGRDGL